MAELITSITASVAGNIVYDILKDYIKTHSFPDASVKIGAMIGSYMKIEPIQENLVQDAFESAIKTLESVYKTPNIISYRLIDGTNVYVEFNTVSTIDNLVEEDFEFMLAQAKTGQNEIEIIPLITQLSLRIYLEKPKNLESLHHAYDSLNKIIEQIKGSIPHTSTMTILYLYTEKEYVERIRKTLLKIKEKDTSFVFQDFNDIYGNAGFEIRDIDRLKIELLIKHLKRGVFAFGR